MPPANPPWDESNPATKQQIEANLIRLAPDIVGSARAREPFSRDLARDWHRRTLEGVAVRDASFVGGLRGEGHPRSELAQYRNRVGGFEGTSPNEVGAELAALEVDLQARIDALDDAVEPNSEPKTAELRREVMEVAARALGEWLRIHPFVDGNGRTARALANWVLVRYGFDPVIRLRPRPAGAQTPAGRDQYHWASEHSMSGRHALMRRFIEHELQNP